MRPPHYKERMDFHVIITMNEKNKAAYDALFARAYKALKDKGQLREDCIHEDERLHGIEEYFAHMEYLAQLDPLFVMIPLDEAEFVINANTRSISAPKITVVQKDNSAEMLIFTIDRYFDFMDLAAQDMQIRVQWILPSGRSEAQDFEFIDLRSVPGKIRLGWLLNDAVTSESGDVQYSVRFWKETMIDNENKAIYSFNTLPAKFTVSKALSKEVEGNIYRPLSSGLFAKAITNSVLPGPDGTLPLNPRFGAPGLDLNETASLNDNVLNLIAQAVVSDTGEISYEWYYTPAVDIEGGFKAGVRYAYEDVTTTNGDGEVEIIPGFNRLGGTVNNLDYKLAELKDNVIDPYTSYYKQSDSGFVNSTNPAEDLANDIELYELYTSYSMGDNEQTVIGAYEVEAVNEMNGIFSRPVVSKKCTLVGPNEVTFVNNLADKYVLTGKNDKLSITIGSQPAGTVSSYTWAYSSESDEDLIVMEDTNSNFYEVKNAGWYKAIPSVELNRESKSAESNICLVIGLPEAPAVTYGEVSAAQNLYNGFPEYKNADATEFTLDVEVAAFEGPAALTSDGIIYRWFVTPETGKKEELTEDSDIVVSGLGTNALVIKNPNSSTGDYWNFTCEVTNKLGDNFSDPVEKLFYVYAY